MTSLESSPSQSDPWRDRLTPEQFSVLRQYGTERPFTGAYDHHFAQGLYRCAACGSKLFRSDDKFDSGCGWPAFALPLEPGAVIELQDTSSGMTRTEVRCANCEGHLGHVFDDGPADRGGLRYCINSVALDFDPHNAARATFGGG
ncbi:MAG: peptide-methionine (R)-S-oxide reductase MsrB [Planctomycetes bacterium]|jgi:peptide-methionine (R)-S-oxide reductase|nr:peptide-methionine (R)-S-oxide reductase MsrB [Planctomycetota bacterium]MBT4029023.1 peptide-methionine (R)-S-oxide reductase MsrB [Planctomycetota bacterium]MBT4560357.1 peptide-methionine (R)-S-oxide reductase MsrB [Planctomycetota bacterium]MBT5102046.1 peptide-methionine (R)-S-oxide reductase MsrB [Planctomycetota bacterium]MBT5120937.1 peptide-methionine (R)-S-oxide reductase MsrB [Planctomycetota bacterium]